VLGPVFSWASPLKGVGQELSSVTLAEIWGDVNRLATWLGCQKAIFRLGFGVAEENFSGDLFFFNPQPAKHWPPESKMGKLDLPRPFADGKFELLELIGKGGMANVYKARHLRLGQLRAVKVLRVDPDQRKLDYLRVRLTIEAQAMDKLGENQHVVRIYDVGRDGDYDYIVMELIDGQNVGEVMWPQTNGPPYVPLPFLRVLLIMRVVLEVLVEAHALKIVHRDLKPENIMLTKTGGVKVADFGIAQSGSGNHKLTTVGTKLGSELYWSPEQEAGHIVDWRTDIYSLGVMFFVLLTGNEDTKHMYNWEVDDVRWATVPAFLRPVIRRATQFKRDDRYQSAKEFWTALEAVCLTAGQNMHDLTTAQIDGQEPQPEPSTTFVIELPTSVETHELEPVLSEVLPGVEVEAEPEQLAPAEETEPEVQEGSDEDVEQTASTGWPKWLKVGAGVGVMAALLSLGLGVREMMARQEIAQPEVTQTVPEVKIEVQSEIKPEVPVETTVEPEIKPEPVMVPVKTEVKTTPTVVQPVVKPKPDVVKSEVKPVVTPVAEVPAKYSIEQTHQGQISEGSVVFSASLVPENKLAICVLSYRYGKKDPDGKLSNPQWIRAAMPLGENGQYAVTIGDIDPTADEFRYAIAVNVGAETVRSGTAATPHILTR